MRLGMILELIAALATAIFAGAAIYINLVEHPARMECGTAAAVREWRGATGRARPDKQHVHAAPRARGAIQSQE